MDTSLILTFLEVARRGSFSGAAEALNYTQSAVSRQVATLENELSAPLFERLPRGVLLTEYGEAFVPYAEEIVGNVLAARRAMEMPGADRLRIGAFPTANAALVPIAMRIFALAHPDVSLSLVEGTTPRQFDRLRTGEVDVAVVSAPSRQKLTSADLVISRLLDEPLLVALHAGHHLAGRSTLRLSDLATERWIAGARDPAQTLFADVPALDFQPRIDFAVQEWTAKLGLTAAGFGMTLLPGLAASATRPDIVLASLRGINVPRRRVYVAMRRSRPSANIVAFEEALALAVDELDAELRLRGIALTQS